MLPMKNKLTFSKCGAVILYRALGAFADIVDGAIGGRIEPRSRHDQAAAVSQREKILR